MNIVDGMKHERREWNESFKRIIKALCLGRNLSKCDKSRQAVEGTGKNSCKDEQSVRSNSLLPDCPSSSSPSSVILSPFGLNGTLTGQSFKMSDPPTQKLMEEWNQFYPISSKSKECVSEDKLRDMDWEDDSLASVEVLVGQCWDIQCVTPKNTGVQVRGWADCVCVQVVYGWCTQHAWSWFPSQTSPLRPLWGPPSAPLSTRVATKCLHPSESPPWLWWPSPLPLHPRRRPHVMTKPTCVSRGSPPTFCVSTMFFSCPVDSRSAQKWVKMPPASELFSVDRTSHHGGKVPQRLATQMVERVWQECNINRAQNKWDRLLDSVQVNDSFWPFWNWVFVAVRFPALQNQLI